MRIAINAPMKGQDIIDLLGGHNENGVCIMFIKKTGLRFEFEIVGIEESAVCGFVRELIRSTDFGRVLYFTVDKA